MKGHIAKSSTCTSISNQQLSSRSWNWNQLSCRMLSISSVTRKLERMSIWLDIEAKAATFTSFSTARRQSGNHVNRKTWSGLFKGSSSASNLRFWPNCKRMKRLSISSFTSSHSRYQRTGGPTIAPSRISNSYAPETLLIRYRASSGSSSSCTGRSVRLLPLRNSTCESTKWHTSTRKAGTGWQLMKLWQTYS